MKKKIICLMLVSALTISTAACGKPSAPTATDQIKETTTEKSEAFSTENANGTLKESEESNVSKADNSNNTIKAESKSDEIKPPTVLDYGYIVIEGHDCYYIEYAYEMKNENTVDIEFPTVKIIAKDETGSILASDEDVRGYIAAGDTIAQASQISCEKMPASIEIAGVTPDDYNIITNSAAGSSADFEIFNISLQGDSITGEVTNTSAIGYDDGFVATAIFRDADGHIVTGATGYFTNKIAAGETTAFDINCMFDPAEYAYDTITVTAYGGI
ncbi:FxLYD domain-containing protein [Qiania dongpingensis]|uniref:Uncharacterized protein n=1 Tax=Qiania dongpingensis TaxID=2763669 RepID=A0A7G9G3S2_9FIRM|nr:FxLYD domain-containing protein [Qiania dongpingensis]QNM05454.1 hypothetical protein H9Q78_13645 [Qiania dongpingensis]